MIILQFFYHHDHQKRMKVFFKACTSHIRIFISFFVLGVKRGEIKCEIVQFPRNNILYYECQAENSFCAKFFWEKRSLRNS